MATMCFGPDIVHSKQTVAGDLTLSGETIMCSLHQIVKKPKHPLNLGKGPRGMTGERFEKSNLMHETVD